MAIYPNIDYNDDNLTDKERAVLHGIDVLRKDLDHEFVGISDFELAKDVELHSDNGELVIDGVKMLIMVEYELHGEESAFI